LKLFLRLITLNALLSAWVILNMSDINEPLRSSAIKVQRVTSPMHRSSSVFSLLAVIFS
jgi:hypothetical protein